MASSTLRCNHARCDLCFSQNLLPTARTMSATSRVGRLIASSASWTALPRWDWTPLSLPAGWEVPADGGAGFQHMGREAVAKQMRRNSPPDAGALTSLVHRLPHNLRSDGHICPPVVHCTWEEIGLGLHPAPVLTQSLQQLGAQ